MKLKHYRALHNKFGAVRTPYHGVEYDSGIEARRAAELDILVRSGGYEQWTRQVRVRLGKDFVTVVDFSVVGPDGKRWYEEIKGFETREFKRIRRLWKKYGPRPLLIYKMLSNRWQIETLPAATQECDDGRTP